VRNRLIELRRKDGIPIMDEKTVVVVRGYRFSKLLVGPCGRWVIRDMDVQQLACAEFYNDQDIKTLERRSDYRQEITGHDPVHGEFLIMRLLVSEIIPDNVTATQNVLGLPMAVDPSPPLPREFADSSSDGSDCHCNTP
jgi:hypothetical protein